MSAEHIYDAETGEDLGIATDAQSAASERAMIYDGGRGAILIHTDGSVLHLCEWDLRSPDVRIVFAQ